MDQVSHREFLEATAAAGLRLGLGASIAAPGMIWGASTSGPSMAIARYKSPSQTKEAIADQAKQMTTQVINAMGGMGRFVAKGDVVWVKPNIGWNRVPEQAATTNPDVVATIVSLCYSAGAKKVMVGDNSCNPAPASFARSGIQAAQKVGAECSALDERKFRKTDLKGKVLPAWELYADVMSVNNAETLGVNTSGYSLWGSSAGARMAAAIGSNGVVKYGGSDVPRPSTVVIAYTAHSDYSPADPPTFVVVGEEDGIAPPAIMERRVAALRRAEGWIFEAIRFWEASIRNGR